MNHPQFHCQVQLRRLEIAGIGSEGKRSRNTDGKWMRVSFEKHEQAECLISTKPN